MRKRTVASGVALGLGLSLLPATASQAATIHSKTFACKTKGAGANTHVSGKVRYRWTRDSKGHLRPYDASFVGTKRYTQALPKGRSHKWTFWTSSISRDDASSMWTSTRNPVRWSKAYLPAGTSPNDTTLTGRWDTNFTRHPVTCTARISIVRGDG